MSSVEMAGVSHTHEQVIVRRLNVNNRFSTTDAFSFAQSGQDLSVNGKRLQCPPVVLCLMPTP